MILWIASYPRSGNTFFRTVLHEAFGFDTWSLYPEGNDRCGVAGDLTGNRKFHKDFRLQDAADDEDLYFVKTHGRPKDDSKAIYLIRDGRAAISSYFHFLRNRRRTNLTLTDTIIGNVGFGPWAAHAMSWHPQSREDTLLIKFEDLVTNPSSQFSRIGKFIGRRAKRRATVPNFADLQSRNSTFFRTGSNDAWRADFSEDDENLFWTLHGDVMSQYGYCNPADALHRAARGGWSLAGDVVRLRTELNKMSEPQAKAA